MKQLSNYELNELACLHGEMLALLDKYKHLNDTKRWQTLQKDTEKDYQYLVNTYDNRTNPQDK